MSGTRVERKVNDLIDDDPEMADVLAVVAERCKANGGGVDWGDVKDELSSGQWSRLIQNDVVVDEDDDGKFELADPDAVDAALAERNTKSVSSSPVFESNDEDSETGDDDEDEGWSTMDKAAGVGVALVMAGYYYQPVQNVIGGAINVFLGPIDQALPFYAVILILAMLTGLYSSVLRANLMDTSNMSEYQEKQEELKEREKRAKEEGDDEELERIREERMEMMTESMSMMTEQFRPMVYIMLLTIPLFLWMYWSILSGHISGPEFMVVGAEGDVKPGVIMPILGETQWVAGIVGPMQAWIVWYFVCSMGFTQLIQKSIDLDMSPT